MDGQMTGDQRQMVHEVILEHRPYVVVECGTWFGGGSTLAAAKALRQTGGIMHTYESDLDRYVSAVTSYHRECPELMGTVRFNYGDFLWSVLLPNRFDMALLDGPEDAAFTYHALLICLNRGANYLILHDWNAHKCEAIRSRLDDLGLVIDRIIPDNVGIVGLKRKDAS